MARSDFLSGIGETVRTVAVAVAVALAIRTVAFEPFNIPSGSMIPSLLIGDYLFVSKYSYGYSRYSLPFGPALFEGRIFASEPKRGDIAVFKLPRDNETDYIKRIIGLPGDRIQVKDGVLYINDQAVKRERIDDFTQTDARGNVRRIAQYRETLADGVTYLTLDMGDSGEFDHTRVFTVPAGHYFAMGDNRDNSLDSRRLDGVGFIPAVNLVGRAEFLFFSVDSEQAHLWEVWRWPLAVRFSRLLKPVS